MLHSFNHNDVTRIIGEVLNPHHFLTSPNLTIEHKHVPSETIPWEIFRGRLLEPRFTRETAGFESWGVHECREGEPLISLKLDWPAGVIHVVRGLNSYVWASADTDGNTIEPR